MSVVKSKSPVTKSKFIIKLSSFDIKTLDGVIREIVNRCQQAMVECSVIPMPTEKQLFVILKSPFIYTIARDQFMYKQHRRVIFVKINQPGQLNDLFKDFQIADGINIEVKTS